MPWFENIIYFINVMANMSSSKSRDEKSGIDLIRKANKRYIEELLCHQVTKFGESPKPHPFVKEFDIFYLPGTYFGIPQWHLRFLDVPNVPIGEGLVLLIPLPQNLTL